mmetsp:Transcript_28072/g.97136  ORF Transcript_28072/g.97136 Transcript_28072/m.97136 type:complete len:222 (+) Transcript_28072:794-1459(+)
MATAPSISPSPRTVRILRLSQLPCLMARAAGMTWSWPLGAKSTPTGRRSSWTSPVPAVSRTAATTWSPSATTTLRARSSSTTATPGSPSPSRTAGCFTTPRAIGGGPFPLTSTTTETTTFSTPGPAAARPAFCTTTMGRRHSRPSSRPDGRRSKRINTPLLSSTWRTTAIWTSCSSSAATRTAEVVALGLRSSSVASTAPTRTRACTSRWPPASRRLCLSG